MDGVRGGGESSKEDIAVIMEGQAKSSKSLLNSRK